MVNIVATLVLLATVVAQLAVRTWFVPRLLLAAPGFLATFYVTEPRNCVRSVDADGIATETCDFFYAGQPISATVNGAIVFGSIVAIVVSLAIGGWLETRRRGPGGPRFTD